MHGVPVMMKIPYQCLEVSRGVVFAAQGPTIFSFSQEFALLSTWNHPQNEEEQKPDQESEAKQAEAQSEAQETSGTEGPPAKRQKVKAGEQPADDEGGENGVQNGEQQAGEEGADQPNKGGRRGRRNKQIIKPSRQVSVKVPFEKPFVSILRATEGEEGLHLVAVTGSDKTVWVFKHDGHGRLELLSHR